MKKQPTFQEIVDAWANFKPPVPLCYIIASRKAIREKNGFRTIKVLTKKTKK